MKKLSPAEWMNIFFFCVLGLGIGYLASSFTLESKEQVELMRESVLKYFVIRFLIYYILAVVFVLLITTVNRILVRVQILPAFNTKRLMYLGLMIEAVIVLVGTGIFFF